jgi:putative ABC transport system permease protein
VLLKNPGFTLVAVLSLGLGIGANTAIFTFVNAALFKPLPYAEPDRIVVLQERQPKTGDATLVHPRSFVEWQDRSRSFEALAILQPLPLNTDGADGPEQVSGMWTTPELFRVFGVAPLLGRVFTAAEARPGGSPVAILSHGYWQRRFAADPPIVGKTIQMQSQAAVIVE